MSQYIQVQVVVCLFFKFSYKVKLQFLHYCCAKSLTRNPLKVAKHAQRVFLMMLLYQCIPLVQFLYGITAVHKRADEVALDTLMQ